MHIEVTAGARWSAAFRRPDGFLRLQSEDVAVDLEPIGFRPRDLTKHIGRALGQPGLSIAMLEQRRTQCGWPYLLLRAGPPGPAPAVLVAAYEFLSHLGMAIIRPHGPRAATMDRAVLLALLDSAWPSWRGQGPAALHELWQPPDGDDQCSNPYFPRSR
jgi:hypothetical protein